MSCFYSLHVNKSERKSFLSTFQVQQHFFYFSWNELFKVWFSKTITEHSKLNKMNICWQNSSMQVKFHFSFTSNINQKWKFCMLYINTLFWITCREDFFSAFHYSLCYGTSMKTRCNWRRRWKQADRWMCEDDRLTVYFNEMVDAEIKQKLDITRSIQHKHIFKAIHSKLMN